MNTVQATLAERGENYGDPKANFARIVGGWNILFGHKLSKPLTEGDVARAMIWLKLARSVNNPKHYDDYLDTVGYALLGADLEDAS